MLNDIFRYIIEEEDEAEPEQSQPEALDKGFEESAPVAVEDHLSETLTSSHDPEAIEHDANLVNKELEEKVLNDTQAEQSEAPSAAVNGTSATDDSEPVHAEEPSSATNATPSPEAVTAAPVLAAPAALEPEKPKEPSPTPAVASPMKQAAQPASASSGAPAPSKPSAPKTWANLAAAAHRVVTPAVPAPQQATSPAPSQAKAVPAPVSTTSTPAPAAALAPASQSETANVDQQDEWTSVGGDNKKQQAKAQAGPGAQEGPQSRAYIKNVHDTVGEKELRTLLEKFGEISYFDVARQKVCIECLTSTFKANDIGRTAHLSTSRPQRDTRLLSMLIHTSSAMTV